MTRSVAIQCQAHGEWIEHFPRQHKIFRRPFRRPSGGHAAMAINPYKKTIAGGGAG
jgi:hypothetical protein